MTANVDSASSQDTITMSMGPFDVDCAGGGKKDGTATAVYSLTATTAGDGVATQLDGTVEYTYRPLPGSKCTAKAVGPKSESTVTGIRGAIPSAAFPQPGADELLLNRHSGAGICKRASRPAEASAAIVCTLGSRTKDELGNVRPDSYQLAQYKSVAALVRAYERVRAATGLKNTGTLVGGYCRTACETYITDTPGRILISERATYTLLVTYESNASLVLITAKAPRGRILSIHTWHSQSYDAVPFNYKIAY